MRTLIALVLVAGTSLSTFAQAQTQAQTQAPSLPQTAQSDASSVRIQGTPNRNLTDEQFEDVSGRYRLTNGKRLTVSTENFRYYIQIDGQRPVEIVPTFRDKEYVAKTSDMQINFDELRGRETVDIVIRTGMRSNNVAVLGSR